MAAATASLWESSEGKKMIRKLQVGREGGREGGEGGREGGREGGEGGREGGREGRWKKG
jgi:hypothetical protein